VSKPSPNEGVFKWARRHAAEHRGSFWVAAVAFTLILSVLGDLITVPSAATAEQKTLVSIATLAVSTTVVLAGTYLAALIAAPFQQRNALRQAISELRIADQANLTAAEAKITELQKAPISAQHAERIRESARSVKRSIEQGRSLDYDGCGGKDSDLWRSVLFAHFPGIEDMMKMIERTDAAVSDFGTRLIKESKEAGMQEPPWLPHNFVEPLVRVINDRSKQELLGGEFRFNWTESGGYMYAGDPMRDDAPSIFRVDESSVDKDALKRKFEEFMRSAEGWPEAQAIWDAFHERQVAEKLALSILPIMVNTDVITTRCFLCDNS